MKWLSLVLVLLVAAPVPPAVAACEMPQEQGAPAEPGQDARPASEHDCCPGAPKPADEPDEHCDSSAHCSACFAGASVVPSAPLTVIAFPLSTEFDSLAISSPPSHDLPPYRPPIS
ncbi:MAG: hypothetical protein V2I48_10340 [Xanthomonadales bacterium]|jgi:hypothetical protein|nr:hypothetical protein [Xanthomonadales bacterium]